MDSGGTASARFLEAACWKWIPFLTSKTAIPLTDFLHLWASALCGFPSPSCSPHRCNGWLLQIVSQKGWNPRLYSTWLQNSIDFKSEYCVASILGNSAGRARSRCLPLGVVYSEAFKLSCYVSLVVLFHRAPPTQHADLNTLPFPPCITAHSGVTMTFSWHADEGFSWTGNAAPL